MNTRADAVLPCVTVRDLMAGAIRESDHELAQILATGLMFGWTEYIAERDTRPSLWLNTETREIFAGDFDAFAEMLTANAPAHLRVTTQLLN